MFKWLVLNLMNISNQKFQLHQLPHAKKKITIVPSFGSKIRETSLTFIYALDNEGSV
jgi:hypothetical protein